MRRHSKNNDSYDNYDEEGDIEEELSNEQDNEACSRNNEGDLSDGVYSFLSDQNDSIKRHKTTLVSSFSSILIPKES